MKVTDFINGKVSYDKHGQYFWIHGSSNGILMLGELRGWGHIQNMFKDGDGNIRTTAAEMFQDEVGEWIADAINAKLETETEQAKISSNALAMRSVCHPNTHNLDIMHLGCCTKCGGTRFKQTDE